jgi:nitrogen fixation/metabolism regulation signal transduction histidine kinase
MYLLFTFLTAFSILIFASFNNPDLYKIDKETLIVINQAFNAIVLLVIPFLLGSLGATARILMAGVKAGQQGVLIVSSGLMAMFSWVGIKSGVLLAIVAPHLENQGVPNQVTMQSETNFYTMALVAILVGMFSSNLYIFVNQRVEQLISKQSPNKQG